MLANIELPQSLSTHAAVAAILNHNPNRQSLAEIRAASHARAAEEEARLAKLRASSAQRSVTAGHIFDYSVDPNKDVAFPGDTRAIKQSIFLSQLTAYTQHERSLDVNPTKHRIGQAVMTETERDELEEQREAAKKLDKRKQRMTDSNRTRHQYDRQPVAYIVNQQFSNFYPVPTFDLALNQPSKFEQLGLHESADNASFNDESEDVRVNQYVDPSDGPQIPDSIRAEMAKLMLTDVAPECAPCRSYVDIAYKRAVIDEREADLAAKESQTITQPKPAANKKKGR